MIKQIIVMRKDLGMCRGKQIAQGCHASMKIFFDRMHQDEDNPFDNKMCCQMTDEMREWKMGAFTKICLYVNSEEELLDINKQAIESNLPVALIQDVGKTEFNNVLTYTCLAIGPDKAEKIDKITKNLKLL